MGSVDTERVIERLSRAPWLAPYGRGLAEALVAGGRLVRLAAGQWTHAEGDLETGIVFVIEGALQFYVNAPGDREVLLAHAEAGSTMGQTARFGGGPRAVTSICVVESLVLVVADAALTRLAAKEPDLWRAVASLANVQLRTMIATAVELKALPPRQRLAARLLAIAAPMRARPPVGLHLNQQALGELIGVTRKTANRLLAALEAEGLVRLGYGRLELLDMSGLRRVAES